MNKRDYDDLIIPSNKPGGPPLIPLGFLEYGEVVYFYRGRFCVNLGGGWMPIDLEHSNIRGIDVDIYEGRFPEHRSS
jgi:hypothetical protein